MAVRVITDSTSYLSRALRTAFDIGVVSLSSLLDGVTYSDDAEDYGPFYRALSQTRSFPTTSQPSLHEMASAMEARVAGGDEVAGVFISERMSGTYSTALLARDMVLARHPDATIEIVDGLSNSMELGYSVLAAARAAANGRAMSQVLAAARSTMARTRFLFVPETLEYLHRGGRIGGASALIGTILRIRPILTVRDGVTEVFEKVRTQQKALDTIAAAVARDVRANGGIDEVVVHHIDSVDVGRAFAATLSDVVGRAVDLLPIGPAIGAHVGPGAVGVVYSTLGPMGKNT